MLENLFNYATSFAASPMEMRQKPGTQFVFLTQPHSLFCRHNLNFELLMSRSGPKERLIMVRSCNLCWIWKTTVRARELCMIRFLVLQASGGHQEERSGHKLVKRVVHTFFYVNFYWHFFILFYFILSVKGCKPEVAGDLHNYVVQ